MDTAIIVIMFFLLVCLILIGESYLYARREGQKAAEVYNRKIFDLQEQVSELEKENRRLSNWLSFCNVENSARISEGYETQLEVLRDELRRTKKLKDMYAREFERRGIVVQVPAEGMEGD